jgi:alkyldihydroxyacetonephosphate synthase
MLMQVYDTGAAVYVYFGFEIQGVNDPIKTYSEIEDAARDEIMKHGGSISHHHGVGKLRKKFLERSVGTTGVDILKGLKNTIDPVNIFATGNLV